MVVGLFFSSSNVSWSLDFFFFFLTIFLPPLTFLYFYVTLTYWMYNIVSTTQLHHCLPFTRTQTNTDNWYAYHVSFHSQFISLKYFYIPKQIFTKNAIKPPFLRSQWPTHKLLHCKYPTTTTHSSLLQPRRTNRGRTSCTIRTLVYYGRLFPSTNDFFNFFVQPGTESHGLFSNRSLLQEGNTVNSGKRLRLSFQTIECTPCAGSSSRRQQTSPALQNLVWCAAIQVHSCPLYLTK